VALQCTLTRAGTAASCSATGTSVRAHLIPCSNRNGPVSSSTLSLDDPMHTCVADLQFGELVCWNFARCYVKWSVRKNSYAAMIFFLRLPPEAGASGTTVSVHPDCR
jgi:hypothetical protein